MGNRSCNRQNLSAAAPGESAADSEKETDRGTAANSNAKSFRSDSPRTAKELWSPRSQKSSEAERLASGASLQTETGQRERRSTSSISTVQSRAPDSRAAAAASIPAAAQHSKPAGISPTTRAESSVSSPASAGDRSTDAESAPTGAAGPAEPAARSAPAAAGSTADSNNAVPAAAVTTQMHSAQVPHLNEQL